MKCQGCGECFMGEDREDEEVHQQFVDWAYEYTKEILQDGEIDIVILDEINNALRYKLLSVEEVLDLTELKRDKTELILTGRGMPEEILAAADLVTEMKERKHPFQQGISSRRGTEY
jgi:cob(I)alamin adenosyltransferase